MYSDAITLFNRVRLTTGDVWYPTILRGVDLNIDKAAIIAKYGAESADNARLHIKYRLEAGAVVVGGKKYLPPKEWHRQERDEMAQSLTFTDGVDFDFFIVGEWSEDEINDNEFIEGFYSYMNSRFDYVFSITSVAKYSVIPHFEIMAK